MKFLSLLFVICLSLLDTNAQEINYETIKGTWEYKSPKAKTKLTYKFDLENKFTGITERKGDEIQINGSYEFDKKDNLDRLILNTIDRENGTRTQILYRLIKSLRPDTLKIQQVNEKQAKWLPETKRNTMTL